MKFVDVFERIYVINLPHRTDRRRAIDLELRKAGMPLTLSRVELFSGIRPDHPGKFESIGYHGCFLSHLAVLKQAKSLGLNNVLVMEDDLYFTKEFYHYEAAIAHQLTEIDWDLVQFGYYPDVLPQVNQSHGFLQSCDEELIGAHFYAVNGKALDRLITFFELLLDRPAGHPDGGPMSPDGVLNIFPRQNSSIIQFISVPSLGGQRSSRSDISPRWIDRTPVLSQVAGAARDLGIPRMVKGLLKM
jgi:glycosyl transferase family 25